MLKVIYCLLFFICVQNSVGYAQDSKVSVSAYDGIIIGGYVDNGGFTNFTGPNINLVHNNSKFILSALPSLRYKNDNSTPKNSFVTPNLGIGFTYCYKHFAIQIPLYYNAKTATRNGNWQIGFGIGLRLNGLRLNGLNKKNKL